MNQPIPPQDESNSDPLDQEAMDFLLAQREEAIAQGISFIGAITGGDEAPRVISYIAPDHTPHEDSDAQL